MPAKVFEIAAKVKKWDLELARATDFSTHPPVASDPGKIIAAPHISLYCLDPENREVVFVEVPPGMDVSQRPFLFLTQYQNAQRVWTVSYETFHQLAAGMGDRFTRLIPMYSIGRCGGTLVSRALSRLETVLSLDEPDLYCHIVQLRLAGRSRDEELKELIHSGTRLLFKPFTASADTLFLKFRPQCIAIGDLMHRAFPSANAMFLYRNADGWARSVRKVIESKTEPTSGADQDHPFAGMLRAADVADGESPTRIGRSSGRISSMMKEANAMPLLRDFVQREVARQLNGPQKLHILGLALAERIPWLRARCQSPIDYVRPQLRAISSIKLIAAVWLSLIDQYLNLRSQGIPIAGVRYETLVAQPHAALAAIFRYCGLPLEQVAVARGAFAEDSQKGTPLSRETVGREPLAPELLEELREFLRQYPSIGRPDFIAPGTLELAAGAQ
jgi:hypothetical protein